MLSLKSRQELGMFNFSVFLSTTLTFLVLPASSLSGHAFQVQRVHNLLRKAEEIQVEVTCL